MTIAVAGPYSSDDEAQRRKNLDAMNEAAARLLERGHVPLIGVNAALAVVEKAKVKDKREAIMQISLALVNCCEAILILGESPGANRERDLILSNGLRVYYRLEEVPYAY